MPSAEILEIIRDVSSKVLAQAVSLPLPSSRSHTWEKKNILSADLIRVAVKINTRELIRGAACPDVFGGEGGRTAASLANSYKAVLRASIHPSVGVVFSSGWSGGGTAAIILTIAFKTGAVMVQPARVGRKGLAEPLSPQCESKRPLRE